MTDKYDEIQQKNEYVGLFPPYRHPPYPGYDRTQAERWLDQYNQLRPQTPKVGIMQEHVEIPTEMFEFINVLYHSANTGKYEPNNWLKPDGQNSDHKSMCASMFRHLAAATEGKDKDTDSGLHPLLHLASRALMLYTRKKRGLA